MAAALAALAVANSPLATAYFGALGTYVAGLSLLHWINDALIAVFFLLVVGAIGSDRGTCFAPRKTCVASDHHTLTT